MKITKRVMPLNHVSHTIIETLKKDNPKKRNKNLDNFFTINVLNYFQPEIILSNINENSENKKIFLNIEVYQNEALKITNDTHISKIKSLFIKKVSDLSEQKNTKNDDFSNNFDTLYLNITSPHYNNEILLQLSYFFENANNKSNFKICKFNFKNNYDGWEILSYLICCIKNLTSLKLNMKNTNFSQCTYKKFSEIFLKLTNLRNLKLNISHNPRIFKMENPINFSPKKQKIPALSKINLNFSKTPCTIITVYTINEILSQNFLKLKILKLNLSSSNIIDDYVIMLSKNIQKLSLLKFLKINLKNNFLHNNGVNEFSKALSRLFNLKNVSLDLSENLFEEGALNNLLENLMKIQKMKYISIKLENPSNFTDKCIIKLSELIKAQKKLRKLIIKTSSLKISPENIKILLISFKSLKKVKTLHLCLNDIEFSEQKLVVSPELNNSNRPRQKTNPSIISEMQEKENNIQTSSEEEEKNSPSRPSKKSVSPILSPKKLSENKCFFAKTVEFKEPPTKIRKTLKNMQRQEDLKNFLTNYQINTYLQNLHLSLSRTNLDYRGLEIISKIFEFNFFQNLKKLELILSNNKLTSGNCEQLFFELENLSNLNHLSLNLKHNRLQNRGLLYLSSTIGKLTNLTYLNLNLRGNSISKDGFTSISNAISLLPYLYFLKINLRQNYVSKEAVECLPRTFQNLTSLKFFILSLHYNVLEAEGIQTIAKGLAKINPELSHLDLNLGYNNASEEYDFKKIIVNLMHFQKLKYFSLNLNDLKMSAFNEYQILKEFFDKILNKLSVFKLFLGKSDARNEILNTFLTSLGKTPKKIQQILLHFYFTPINLDYKFLENFKVSPLENLKALNMDFSGNFEKNSKFAMESIAKILSQTRFLEKLQLILNGDTFSNESFFIFNLELANLKFLRVLSLNFSSSNLSAEFIVKLSKSFEKFTHLSELDVILENNEITELKSIEKMFVSLKNSRFSLEKLKIDANNTFLNHDDQSFKNCLIALNELKFLKTLYLDLGLNKLNLTKIFEIFKENTLILSYLQYFYLNLDLNSFEDNQTTPKIEEIYKILRESCVYLKFLKINLNLNEVFLNNNIMNDKNNFLGIFPQLNRIRKQSIIDSQKRDSIEISSKRRRTTIFSNRRFTGISFDGSDTSEADSLCNIAQNLNEENSQEMKIFKAKSIDGKKKLKKFSKKLFFQNKKTRYPAKKISLKMINSKIKGIGLQINQIKKPKIEEIFNVVKLIKPFLWNSLNLLVCKFNNIICPDILEMDLSFLLNFSRKIFVQCYLDFPPAYSHKIWAKLSILNHFDDFKLKILNENICSFHHSRINFFYFTKIFQNCFYFNGNINSKKVRARTSSIHYLDEKKSLKSYITEYTDMILVQTPLVSFDFETFFEKTSHLFSLKTLLILCDNTLLFCKFNQSHLKKLLFLFKPEDSEASKTINQILRTTLKSILHIDLIAYILSSKTLSQFLNIKSFEMLINFFKKLKHQKNVLIWKITKKRIIELNLEKNLNICTSSCTNGLLNILDNYWESFKLETPCDGTDSQMQNFEKEINYFYSGIREHINSFKFKYLDDSYQGILISLLECLPNLKRINLSFLNLTDDFCEKFSDLLVKGNFLKLEYIDISHNPRITNVGLKYMAVGLGYHREKYKKNKEKNIEIHIRKTFKNNETILLDQGLEKAIKKRLRNYFTNRNYFCYACMREVCSKCHFPSVDNKKHDCKRKRQFETNINPLCLLKQNERKTHWYQNIFQDPYFIIILFYLIIAMPTHFCNFVLLLFKQLLSKLKKNKTDSRKTKAAISCKSPKMISKNNENKNISLFSLWTANLDSGSKFNTFKYDKRVLTVENYLKSYRILCIIIIFQIVNYMTCFFFPLFLQDQSFIVFETTFSYSYIFLICYCAICWFFEFYFSKKIITKLNSNSKEPLIHDFNFKNYGFFILQTLAYKIGFFFDSFFVLIVVRSQNIEREENRDNDNLYVITTIIFIFYVIINFTMWIKCLKYAFQNLSYSMNDFEINGIGNLVINFYTRLAVLGDFHCLAKILDTFSTKSAVKIKSIYISQIVISSLLKFLLDDFPLMIAQIYFSLDLKMKNEYFFSLIILFKIITFYSAFYTALNARASSFSREDLEKLFKPSSKKNIESTTNEDLNKITMMESENFTSNLKGKLDFSKRKRKDIQKLREMNGLQNNSIMNNKRFSYRVSKKWTSNYEPLWLEGEKNTKMIDLFSRNRGIMEKSKLTKNE